MNQPTIRCPHCKAEVRLTEALAARLIRTNKKIAEKETEIARRESAILAQGAELARAVESIEQQFTARDSRPSERGLRQRRPRRRNFCWRQSLKVGHRKLLTYRRRFNSGTAS